MFVERTRNHVEMRALLVGAGALRDPSEYDALVHDIVRAWLTLGRIHLAEAAETVHNSKLRRAAFSRAYYAAYNASKAVRYLSAGCVSLKGDDHQHTGRLPDDFPAVSTWPRRLTELYEHRLRADYDNWEDTEGLNTLTPAEAIGAAKEFVTAAAEYLERKYGVKP